MGIQRCRVWDMTPSDGVAKNNFLLKPNDYLNTLKKLSEFALKTGAHNIESGDPLFPGRYNTGLNVSGGYCVAMAGVVLIISTEGNVYFCCAQRNSMYNIFENLDVGPLKEFHRLKLKEHYSQFYETPNRCRGCYDFKKCGGGCVIRRRYSQENIDYWCTPQQLEVQRLEAYV